MTYIDNGSPWWHMLLIAVAGGVVAVLVVDGWAWLVDRWAEWRYRQIPDSGIEDAADDTPAPLHGTWTPPRLWTANGRYIHRHDCPHMTTGAPITVWTEDAARRWAESTTPRLASCRYCQPFDKPEPTTDLPDPGESDRLAGAP